MKFTINKDVFKKSLDAIKGGLGAKSKNSDHLLRSYLVYAKQGKIHVNTYDLSTQMSIVIDMPDGAIEAEGRGLINADDLNSIVKVGKKNDDIVISVNESFSWDIEVAGTLYTVSGLSPKLSQVFNPFNVENTIILESAELKRKMESIAPMMAKSDVRYFLNGMLFHIKDDEIVLVATDGHRLARNAVEYSGDIENETQIIIPNDAVQEIIKMLKDIDTMTIGFNDSFLSTTVGNISFKTKLVNGKYPDYSRVIPNDIREDVVFEADKLELLASLEKFDGLGFSKGYAQMRVDFNLNKALFFGKSERSEYKEEFVFAKSTLATSFKTSFNNAYLREAIGLFSGANISMRLRDEKGAMKITSEDNPELIHLVMPMRY